MTYSLNKSFGRAYANVGNENPEVNFLEMFGTIWFLSDFKE